MARAQDKSAQDLDDRQKAVDLTPENGAYWSTLGLAQMRAGDHAAAIEALRESMARSGLVHSERVTADCSIAAGWQPACDSSVRAMRENWG